MIMCAFIGVASQPTSRSIGERAVTQSIDQPEPPPQSDAWRHLEEWCKFGAFEILHPLNGTVVKLHKWLI